MPIGCARSLATAFALALLAAAPALAAGPLDGSKPLVCSNDDNFECSDAHPQCVTEVGSAFVIFGACTAL